MRKIKRNNIKKKLDPKNDLVFHSLFAERNNRLTEAFLSSVLKEDVKVISNLDRHLDISKATEKFGIMDLNVELSDKTKCNVEMQVREYVGEAERFLYYLANLYGRQLKKKDKYGEINRCINIVIINHEIEELKGTKGFVTKWSMKDDETGKNELTNKFELYIISLPRLEKYYRENKEDKLAQWCKFFLDPYSKEVETIMAKNKDIKAAKEKLEILNGDYETQRLAAIHERALHDEASAIEFATEKGLEKGLSQAKVLTAKKMLKLGRDIEDIIEVTELTREEILKLK